MVNMVRMGRRRTPQCEKERYHMMEDVLSRLRDFIENEVRSGSMDFGCITPLYVYRMCGGAIPMEDIENGLMELRNQGFMVG